MWFESNGTQLPSSMIRYCVWGCTGPSSVSPVTPCDDAPPSLSLIGFDNLPNRLRKLPERIDRRKDGRYLRMSVDIAGIHATITPMSISTKLQICKYGR